MTTQEHLWSDINHIRKMLALCIVHVSDLLMKYSRSEITKERLNDILPSAKHQYELFYHRWMELAVGSKLAI